MYATYDSRLCEQNSSGKVGKITIEIKIVANTIIRAYISKKRPFCVKNFTVLYALERLLITILSVYDVTITIDIINVSKEY
jgi:hypothetical protein